MTVTVKPLDVLGINDKVFQKGLSASTEEHIKVIREEFAKSKRYSKPGNTNSETQTGKVTLGQAIKKSQDPSQRPSDLSQDATSSTSTNVKGSNSTCPQPEQVVSEVDPCLLNPTDGQVAGISGMETGSDSQVLNQSINNQQNQSNFQQNRERSRTGRGNNSGGFHYQDRSQYRQKWDSPSLHLPPLCPPVIYPSLLCPSSLCPPQSYAPPSHMPLLTMPLLTMPLPVICPSSLCPPQSYTPPHYAPHSHMPLLNMPPIKKFIFLYCWFFGYFCRSFLSF